jgi:hypothetical protein
MTSVPFLPRVSNDPGARHLARLSGFFFPPSFGHVCQDRPNEGAQPLHVRNHEEVSCHATGKNSQSSVNVSRR